MGCVTGPVPLRYRAGSMGVPFLPARVLMGSDLYPRLPDIRQMECPYTGEKKRFVEKVGFITTPPSEEELRILRELDPE